MTCIMKRQVSFIILLVLGVVASNVSAQVVSSASFLKARQKADVVVPFRVLDEGTATPIEWGLDLAWLDAANIRTGVFYAGRDLIDIVRTSYTATESVADGALSESQVAKIKERAGIIKQYLKNGVSININHDHGDNPNVASWYNSGLASSKVRGQRWAQLIDLSIKKYAELGLTNVVSISPYNEPDFGWGQGNSNSTRKEDFLNIAKSLKNDFNGAYDGVRICGGNTLNDDFALEWWNYLKEYLDEGNTHQLAGSFNNYANFFKTVREYGHHATADELHNTMEAMVGVEYGMQTGIWWGTCEYARSQFMKATYHRNPGKRLAYGEHRNNWTAASLYRHADGTMQLFGGTSERQAVTTSYDFASLDRPVWVNGEPGREYLLVMPGGTGYQTGQTNAETVLDVQSGADIMPHVDGTYKVMNVNSGRLLGLGPNPTSGWNSVTQRGNSSSRYMQWVVAPIEKNGDYSYYTFTLNTGNGMVLDILDWNYNGGADVGVYQGGLGTNEQWYLQYAGNGAFYIRSRYSTRCLEVANSATTMGANVQMGNYTGAKNQQWRFIPANAKPELVAPDAPTALTATPNEASIRLDWTAPTANDVASYTILRSEDGTEYYAIAKDVSGTSFTDNEAADGKEYTYQVYAVDKCYNYSDRSEGVKASVAGGQALVAHLPFESNLNDTTLNGNHAALYGEPQWIEGYTGYMALKLNGEDNFVQLPYTVANHDELTIACWTKWAGGDRWQRLWDFGNGTNQYLFFSPSTDSGMRFAIKDNGDEQQVRTTSTLSRTRWTHVAVTIGANGAVLYIDGEVKAQNESVTIKPSDINPIFNYVGRSQFAADPAYKGNIDDFRIYNYALSAEEIKDLVDTTTGVHAPEMADALPNEVGYDLSGRRVKPDAKGLVVTKGKKVLVK